MTSREYIGTFIALVFMLWVPVLILFTVLTGERIGKAWNDRASGKR